MTKMQKDLLLALESARTRLAVAIAAETKSTPRERRQYYLDTTDRICRSIRKLRRAGPDAPPKPQEWVRALETLQKLPVQEKAHRLCQVLGDIVAGLE
jgi:hypothetical protein